MTSIFAKSTIEDSKKYDKKVLRNFLEETLDILRKHGKSEEEVLWVGNTSGDICMTFSEFKRQVEGIVYMPRGRCAFLFAEGGEKSSYFAGDNKFNRVCADLVVSGDGWFLRRNIHNRMTDKEPSRAADAQYTESPEFWEYILTPVKNTTFLVSGTNDVRIVATDNIDMARNLLTLNAGKADGDPEFKRHEDMSRNAPIAQRKSGPRRVIASLG